jgi:hypothetical protein
MADSSDDDLKAWDNMPPVGSEWGAPDSETLWVLDGVALGLKGTPMELVEHEGEWHLIWQGRELARWLVGETDWQALRAVVVATGDSSAVACWDLAVG